MVSACQKTAPNATEAQGESKRYEMTGKVVSVDKSKRKAKIQHDEVKGYMPAMEMDFPIKDDWVLRELQPNQKINADLVVPANSDYHLENVKIFQMTEADKTNVTTYETGAEKIGTEVPDFKFVNQDSKKISINDFRGKTLIVTFIFTRCPDADMCPAMSINFSDLAKLIETDANLIDTTRLLTVTFDPKNDTPAVLKNYGIGYFGKNAAPNFEIWQLATGEEREINAALDFFGVQAKKADGTNYVHNLRTVIISPEGKISKIHAGNIWKPDDIVRDLTN